MSDNVVMKGYKGFSPGLVCRCKQYAEHTVFEEDKAVICNSGMHFCENPFDVLGYYPFVGDKGELNEFAEVEALDEVKTDDQKKFCTKKLKVGAKLGIQGLINAFVDFTISKVDFKNAKESNTGNRSAATVEGKESFAIATGIEGKARGKKGCYIALAEWEETNDGWKLKNFKSHKVDGKTIKEDVFYMLKNGKFVEVE